MSRNQPSVDQTYKEIWLSSRSDLQHEINHMQRVVDIMPDIARHTIESIFCDSKACAMYDVAINTGEYSDDVADLIEAAFRECGGYNGVNVNGDEGSKWFDPCWPADEMADLEEIAKIVHNLAKADVSISIVVHHYHHF